MVGWSGCSISVIIFFWKSLRISKASLCSAKMLRIINWVNNCINARFTSSRWDDLVAPDKFFWKSIRISWFVVKTRKIVFLSDSASFIPVPLHKNFQTAEDTSSVSIAKWFRMISWVKKCIDAWSDISWWDDLVPPHNF